MKRSKEIRDNWFERVKNFNFNGMRRLVIILLVISIPNLVIGLIVHFFGVRNLRDQMIENHESQILNQIDYIDDQFEALEINLNFTTHEPMFNENITNINFQEDYHLANDITNSLFSKQYSNVLIERIHFFIDGTDPMVFNPQFRWVNNQDLFNYRRYFDLEDDFLWERNLFRETDDAHIFPLVLVKHMNPYIHSSTNNIGFIIELNQEAVMQLLNSLTLSEDSLSFFIDERTGILISNEGTSQYMEDYILSESMEEETRVITWNNKEYSMISGSINRVNHNWRYVSLVPISDIVKPVTTLSTIIVLSSIIGIVMSIIISSLTLRSLFKPIRNMYEKISKNENTHYNIEELETHWSTIREERDKLDRQVKDLNNNIISNILFKFIHNHYNYSQFEELEEKLVLYGMCSTTKYYMYLDTRMEEKANRELFKRLISFKMKTIFPVIFNYKYTGYVIQYDDREKTDRRVKDLLKEFENKVIRYENESIDIYISTHCETLRELKDAINEIGKEKFVQPQNNNVLTIVNMNTIDISTSSSSHSYPHHIEKQIIDLMRFGNQYEVEELVDEFIEELATNDRRIIQEYFMQLYTAINIEIANQNYSPYEIVNKENILELIVNSQNKNEFKKIIINNVLLPFFKKKETQEDDGKTHIVKKTIEFIEENYDNDISLEESADRENVNPYTLSKLFKEVIGINFIEYLTNYRIEKAKELLVETDMKISEIAESIGYQSSYFNRIFKKHTGETPGRYRKKVK